MIIETFRYEIGAGIALRLRLEKSPVSHNFWVLKTDEGKVVAERHDLATDKKTGKPLVIGLTGSVNRFYTFTPNEHDARMLGVTGQMIEGRTYIHCRQERHVVFVGPDAAALEKWNTWGSLIPFINSLNIPYPPLGLNLPNRTINSNSGYATGACIMGLEPHYFKSTWNPGRNSLLLPKPQLDLQLSRHRKSPLPPGRSPEPDTPVSELVG
ncbi:MAG: hypothetical protein HGB29_01860 [Chlorobiaceae bacterium]|nr:hypothetical protein [Chlorobiaceae bacterium]NTW73589.1 hypothetical protein [Chlorobiaceae bacterium]